MGCLFACLLCSLAITSEPICRTRPLWPPNQSVIATARQQRERVSQSSRERRRQKKAPAARASLTVLTPPFSWWQCPLKSPTLVRCGWFFAGGGMAWLLPPVLAVCPPTRPPRESEGQGQSPSQPMPPLFLFLFLQRIDIFFPSQVAIPTPREHFVSGCCLHWFLVFLLPLFTLRQLRFSLLF